MKAVALALMVTAVMPARCPADELPPNSIPCITVDADGRSTATIAWNGPDNEQLAVAVAWRTAHTGKLRLPRLGEILAITSKAANAGIDPNDLRNHPWADVYVATPDRLRLGRMGDGGVAYVASVSGHVRDANGVGVEGVLMRSTPDVGSAVTDANGFYWIDVPWGR